jgi:hypothetical protein
MVRSRMVAPVESLISTVLAVPTTPLAIHPKPWSHLDVEANPMP